MIEMSEVTKVYNMGNNVPSVVALDRVDLRVGKADFIAVMGPSGSGKSTLLYTIGGLLTPTTGDVSVNKVSIYQLTSRERAKFRRENVGFIFQTFELLPYLTSLENVMLPLYLSGASSAQQEEAAQEALDKVGLANRASHKPSELSGGEQQRVAIARGIVNKPSILLADEPTGNLDQESGAEIMKLLCRLHEENELAVILVTHDPANAEIANLVVKMLDGQVLNKSELKRQRWDE